MTEYHHFRYGARADARPDYDEVHEFWHDRSQQEAAETGKTLLAFAIFSALALIGLGFIGGYVAVTMLQWIAATIGDAAAAMPAACSGFTAAECGAAVTEAR